MMPRGTVAATALVVRIAPSTGTIQGVQPKANATPMMYAGDGSSAADIQMEAEIPLQPRELRQRHHEGAEQQDNGPADQIFLLTIGKEQLTDGRRARLRIKNTVEKPNTKKRLRPSAASGLTGSPVRASPATYET